MNLLPAKIKESYTRTFLACIQHFYPVMLEEKKNKIINSKKDGQDVCKYLIKGQKFMEKLKTKNSIIDCNFTIYSAALFRQIIGSSYKKIDFKASLDISKNEERIKKAGESGGGASGELFMFTHDNVLILKTATPQETNMFEEIMFEYMEHLGTHPRSVIGRIYGVFDFTFRESDKSIKLILMENLFTFNNDSMLRKYDLKGSKHSRRVFKSSKESSKVGKDSKIDKVLKDIDFIDIEKELGILPDEKIQLLRSIEEDV